MEEKNNKCLKILLIIFVITTICLSGYIIYDKVLSKKDIQTENNEKEKQNINTNEEHNVNEETIEWVEYLLENDDLEITITRNYKDDPANTLENAKRELNKEEQKNLLTNLNSCIEKYYEKACGFGGPSEYNTKISFGNKTLDIYTTISQIEDQNLINIFNQNYPAEIMDSCENGTNVVSFDYNCAKQAFDNYFN